MTDARRAARCTAVSSVLLLVVTSLVPGHATTQSDSSTAISFSGMGLGIGQVRLNYVDWEESPYFDQKTVGISGYVRVGQHISQYSLMVLDLRAWLAGGRGGDEQLHMDFLRISFVGSFLFYPIQGTRLHVRSGWGLALIHDEEYFGGRCNFNGCTTPTVFGRTDLGFVVEFALGYDLRVSQRLYFTPTVEAAYYVYGRHNLLTQFTLGAVRF